LLATVWAGNCGVPAISRNTLRLTGCVVTIYVMATISQALAIAVQHHQAGRLQAAEQIYRQILAVEPNHVDALHLLGVLAFQVGRHEAAAEYIGRAIGLNGTIAAFHSNLGNVLKAQGKLDGAVICYRRALELKPDYAEAHYNLAAVFKDQGELDKAAACCRRALDLRADDAETHVSLGNVLNAQGRLDEAVACYRRALDLRPNYAEAHSNLGVVLQEQRKLDEAVACYRRALELEPDHAQTHSNLGVALQEQRKLDEAIACYCRALELKPDYAEAHNNLGNALKDQGNLDNAVACYRRALEVEPDYADAHSNLGNALRERGKLDEAVACCRRALELEPDNAEALNNLGNALKDQGKLDEAVACCRRALELKPDFAEAYNAMGAALNDQGKLDESAACYRRALELKPDYAMAHWNQSLLSLLTEDFERGWAEYEWRWKSKRSQWRGFSQALWEGQPLDGRTILLHAEQGFGDTIQFIRYAAQVKQRGGVVILECPRPLLSFLRTCARIDRLVGQGEELPTFDVQAPLLSLPGIFRTSLETIPADVPYLFADPDLTGHWRQELGGIAGFKIGIAWQGNPKYQNDRDRSIPLGCFEPLARCSGVRLLSLQKGAGAGQLQNVADRFPVIDLGSRLDEAAGAFMDTAAVMISLDLVVTSDTSIAHLAGALGVPVWVALPFIPDWRWLLDRNDSPWYPTMRLFRQESRGDWQGVFQRIEGALRQRVARQTIRPNEGP
jgi:tetratricopeptide (TPR) repeat protein